MSSVKRDNFTSSFPIRLPFILFLPDCSIIMLSRIGKSGHPCLVLDLRGKAFSPSSLCMMIAVDFSYMVFSMLRKFPPIPGLLSVFVMKECQILSNVFSTSMEMIIWFYPLFYYYDELP